MKKTISLLLSLVLVLAMLPAQVFAAPATEFQLAVTTTGESLTSLVAGDTVTVQVKSPAADVADFNIVNAGVQFDNTKLTLTKRSSTQVKEAYIAKFDDDGEYYGQQMTTVAKANTNAEVVIQTTNSNPEGYTLPANTVILEATFTVNEGVTGNAVFTGILGSFYCYVGGASTNTVTDYTMADAVTVNIPKPPCATHNFSKQVIDDLYKVSPATCTSAAVYKYLCVECDAVGTATYTYGGLLDHDFTEQNTDASYKVDGTGVNCQDKVEYYYGCKNCEAISDSLTWESDVAGAHSFTEQKEDAAHLVAGTGVNCQSKKQYYYDCALCDAIGTTTWTSESVGDHVLSAYVQENDKHYKTCTVDGCEYSTAPEACTGGDPATCQTKSVCATCNNTYGEFAAHNLTTGYVPFGAEGHAHKCQTPNCTHNDGIIDHTGMEGDKICDDCAYDANCKHEGTKTTHNAVASTCKTPGNAQYVTCDNCSAVIEGSDAPLALDPDNHTGEGTKLGTNKADPTCSNPGNTGDTLCAGCDAVLQEGTEIPAQHTLTKIPGTAANCSATGVVDTWKCSGTCDKTYIDEVATIEATETNVVIAIDPDAHVWGEDGKCINPKHVKTETEVEPGQKVETELPEEIKNVIDGKEVLIEIQKVVEATIEVIEKSNWNTLFKDGSVEVVEGKLLVYELLPNVPEGEYNIEVVVDDIVYVANVVVEKAEGDYDRPNRPSYTTPDAVKKVIEMIDELPSVKKVTLADQKEIEAARKAYDALTKTNQAKVTNYDDLVAAEEALEALLEAPVVASNPFVDVANDAYYTDAVLWAVENNITSGTSANTFSPDAVCTRAQVVTFLWRAAGSPAPLTAGMPFTDVEAGAYYAAAVQWAVENNITAGTSATTFDPNGQCTRGQIVTFLWRAQGNPAAAAVNSFVDVEADAYYAAPVLWAVANGITNGTSATTFGPAADCTRAQVVTFLYRCMAE